MKTSEKKTEIPKPGPELSKLQVFIGNWHVEAINSNDAPAAPNLKGLGNSKFEWMTGEFFMTSAWEVNFGNHAHIGVSVIGFDTENNTFTARNFDNMGYFRAYELSQEGNIWTWRGEHERAETRFSSDGGSFIENWDIKTDKGWQPLCEMKGTKT